MVFRIFGAAFPEAASRWFERLIITPSRYTNPKDGTPPPDGNHSSVPFNRGMLSVWTWGPEDGPAVILVHGWGGKAAHLLEFVRPLAQNGFRVVAYDQPAHGRSHGKTTTLVECGEALLEIGRHLGKVHGIIAHSFGCPTAAYAIKNGLEIERMVFLGSPASIVELGQDIAEYIGLPRRVAEIMQERVARKAGYDWRASDTDKILEGVDIPILAFHDRSDSEVPLHHGETLERLLPTAKMVYTNGLGHRRIVRDPEIAGEAARFLGVGIPDSL